MRKLLLLLLLGPLVLAQSERSPQPLSDIHQEAVELLRQAYRAKQENERQLSADLFSRVAEKVLYLAEHGMFRRETLRSLSADLRRLSGEAASGKQLAPIDVYLAVLDESRPGLEGKLPEKLDFRGAYSGAKVVDQAGGGHASGGMGAAPEAPRPEDDLREVGKRLTFIPNFEEAPLILEKTFCGGPTKDHILESGGSGVAVFDYDNDGWLDIFLVTGFRLGPDREPVPGRNALYRNLGNWRFENVTARSGVGIAASGNGVCTGDYNDDGYLDVYFTNYGPNFLFKNNGDGTFSEVAAKANVDYSGWSTGCAFFDADGDQDLDLYVANYVRTTWEEVRRAERTLVWRGGPRVMVGPSGLPGEPDVFYRNRGDGTFSDATRESGFGHDIAFYGFGVLATDYDDDGWIDLYVANDSNPNFLYHNQGSGNFVEVGLTSGAALSADGRAQAGMGVDAGDFDGDGLLDLLVTNFAQDTNTLYKNLGYGQFEDVSQAAGLYSRTYKPLGWGAAFFDADQDGWLDLFFANGHVYPQVDEFPHLQETFHQKNQLLLNVEGTFRDISGAAGTGLQIRKSSRGLALGDLDNDGDLDVVITNVDDTPSVLENRSKSANHWIGIGLRKEGKNRFCFGARVSITARGKKQIREVRSGGTYVSQNDLRVYFGLGPNPEPVDVEVKLGGKKWEWKNLPADRLHHLRLEP